MINFTDLYDKTIDNLFEFGMKFTADREMIKDCIQDVFVKLYTKKDELSKFFGLNIWSVAVFGYLCQEQNNYCTQLNHGSRTDHKTLRPRA